MQGSQDKEACMMDYPLSFTAFARAQFLSLTTYRKSGVTVATPVWFAFAESTGTIYFETEAQTGKVRRIRKTARVTLAACTGLGRITGPTMEARARRVNDAHEMRRAEAALACKYGLRRKLASGFPTTVRKLLHKPPLQTVYLAVEPCGQTGEGSVQAEE